MVKSTLGIVGRLDDMASGSGLRCVFLGVSRPGQSRGGGQAQGKLGWNWKQEKQVPRQKQKGIIDANRSDRGMHDENVSATEMMEAFAPGGGEKREWTNGGTQQQTKRNRPFETAPVHVRRVN